MTSEEIAISNKLIADFMGIPTRRSDFGEIVYQYGIDGGERSKEAPVLYSSSWNWLMIVVEKIESLGYSFSIISNLSSIYENGDLLFERPHKEPPLSKLMSAYKVSIDFINWYNTKP